MLAAALALAILACGGDPAPAPVDTPATAAPATETATVPAPARPVEIDDPGYCIEPVLEAYQGAIDHLTAIHELEAIRDEGNAEAVDAVLELLEAWEGPYDEFMLEIGCETTA